MAVSLRSKGEEEEQTAVIIYDIDEEQHFRFNFFMIYHDTLLI